jgi:hypothetical protein
LHACAGTQFDPDVVEALHRAIAPQLLVPIAAQAEESSDPATEAGQAGLPSLGYV